MSLFGLFDIGKSAMLASQTALSATSHNIANVNTPGFSRQEVILEIANPVALKGGFVGGGVTISGIKRDYDRFIQSQLLEQEQNSGRSFALSQSLSQIEQVFNETQGMGLTIPLSEYADAWNQVTAHPDGIAQRNILMQKAKSLVTAAKEMERGITDTLRQTREEIPDVVERVNTISSQIASLNGKIVQIEAGQNRGEANDLRDQRDDLLNDLSHLVEISSFEDENGSITITAGMRNLVYGEKANILSIRVNRDGNTDLSLDGISITRNITRGQLGGLLAAERDIQSHSLHDLRKLIASITKETNILHTAGYALDGTTGNDFFSPIQLSTEKFSTSAGITSTVTNINQLTLDEYSITFDNANNYSITNRQTGGLVASGTYTSGTPITFDGIQVVITGAVTSTDTFTVSPLTEAIRNFDLAFTDPGKIAAASSNTTLPSDNTRALSIVQLSNASIADLGNSSFTGYYRGIIADVGTTSRTASDSFRFDDNLLSELKSKRESISGVSLDEEAANLIRFQRSFEAGARMIQVTDELLQTILNL